MPRKRSRDRWSHEKQNKKPISVEFHHELFNSGISQTLIFLPDPLMGPAPQTFENKRPEVTLLKVVTRLT